MPTFSEGTIPPFPFIPFNSPQMTPSIQFRHHQMAQPIHRIHSPQFSPISHSLHFFPSFFCLLILAIICAQIFVPIKAEMDSGNKKEGAAFWAIGRPRRAASRRLNSGSGESSGFPYRNRYYVSRWDRRRFVPLISASREEEPSIGNEQNEPQRLCGIKLTHRTRELCGECAPANMRRVELMDKKSDKTVETREKLTEMCCAKRCTDDQIRNYCCRG